MPPPDSQPDDAEIVRRLQLGDDTALRMLIQHHGPQITAGLRRRWGPGIKTEDLDEIIIAGLAQLWRKRESFDPQRGSIGAWFNRITEREGLQILRERGRQRRGGLPMDGSEVADAAAGGAAVLGHGNSAWRDSQPQAGTPAPPGKVTAALLEIVKRLPSTQRRVIEADLRSGDVADAEIIGAEIGISANAIYSARSRGRARIRAELKKLGYFHDGTGQDDQESET